MAGNLPDGDSRLTLDDDELGNRLARSFSKPITDLAETDVPIVNPSDSLVDLVEKIAASRTTVLPVCDAERRILGLVDEGEVMRALAEALNLKNGNTANGEEIVEVET
jgi:CBS-domain-containing membrane protein